MFFQFLYQLIYSPTVNKVLRNVLRLFGVKGQLQLPPSGIVSFDIGKNQKFRLHTNQTNYVTKLLFWNGYESFEYVSIFEKLINKINIFYDVGANIGLYSIVAGKVNTSVAIYSFEPSVGPHHYLEKNIRLNKLNNVKLEKMALGAFDGRLKFSEVLNSKYTYLKHNLAGEGNSSQKKSDKLFQDFEVEVTTIDTYVTVHKHKIDLIKIDTEGTEHLILQGAINTIKKMRPIIIGETLYNLIEAELEKTLKPLGYQFFNHTEAGLKHVETIIRTADDGVRNCFFVPEEKVNLVEEFVVKEKD
ncbi:MAG: FkbM family methyltransferase [Bacteroidota bacterium]